MEKIKYNLVKRDKPVVLPEELGFGKIFTDHVFEMDYSAGIGWHNPVIKKLEDIPMHPASMYLHYGQGVFDGLKAFKTESGEVVIFRPQRHIQRINNSSKKLCIPEVDTEFLLHALMELIRIEKDWIPAKTGEALYIRPFIYGSEPFLGVKPSSEYKLIIMLSPVGAYYPEGFKPVKILVTDDYVRAVRKGLGDCKTPANYAASLLGGEVAKKQGFTQVLWLDGVEQKYIEEVGTMNIFIQFKNEIATPKLDGSILPGVTRDSVIQILKDWNMNVTERLISIDEVVEEYKKGNVVGVFGTGTAAIISPVGWLTYKGFEMTFNNGQPGELDVKLFNEITSIHYGKKEDTHGWIVHVENKEVEV
ncbi:MAG: branched-chain amino acid aminotransferase [Ignavibacteriaceae bacterium]|nr:branched-chain amino acid aminotransferase [Ignavibacteriaceae bacterium]